MAPRIGLALGSGGMRGLAHLGVLRVLEAEGIALHCVAGCSIGSLIGALYCAGHAPDTILKLAKHLKRRHWFDLVLPKMGLISGERTLETMRLLTKRLSFEALELPLAVVATDLDAGECVTLTSGSVCEAVRASISVPGIFVPYEKDGHSLVDGAVLNPVPVAAARQLGADIVLAVDLSYARTEFRMHTMFDVIFKSIDIMQQTLMRDWRERQDVLLLHPEVAHVAPSSFEHIDECVALGEASAREMLPQLRRLLDAAD